MNEKKDRQMRGVCLPLHNVFFFLFYGICRVTTVQQNSTSIDIHTISGSVGYLVNWICSLNSI